MNQVQLLGRFVRDPETRYSQGENATCVTRFTIAVNRRSKDAGADFISCIAFGKSGESIFQYFKKGNAICLAGHIQTGSYEKDGNRVYTTDVIVDNWEFTESKNASTNSETSTQKSNDGFVNIPDGVDDGGLPFN